MPALAAHTSTPYRLPDKTLYSTAGCSSYSAMPRRRGTECHEEA